MILGRNPFPLMYVLLTVFVVLSKSLQFSGGRRKTFDTIQKYFPYENSLCVVLMDSDTGIFFPKFHVPVVVVKQDQVLQDCGKASTDHDGYVFITSNSENLGENIASLLECFNQTALKLTTKYILVLDVFENNQISNYIQIYSNFFNKLWKDFRIINIAILPVLDENLETNSPEIFICNPFLARYNSSSIAHKSTLTQDIRGVMIDRFRNMHGHRIRTFFFNPGNSFVTLDILSKKQTVGADPGFLFKQIIEENHNVSFDAYESPGGLTGKGVLEELISGRAEYLIHFLILQPDMMIMKNIQIIPSTFSLDVVFVVPKPRQIESWRLFQYIFQWRVCVGLGIVLLLLSGTALLFVHVHSETHLIILHTEIVSVWKAALSVSINKLPSSHSQRLLIALSLLLGLIFVTLFSAQLFVLVKSKPRLVSIKTLQDLQDSNLPIYVVHKPLASFLNTFENTTLHKLKDNFKADNMYGNANDYLNPHYFNITDRALLYLEPMIQAIMSRPENKAFLQYFEIVNEPIIQSLLLMYLPVGSLYYDQFNQLNLRLISGGFYHKWCEANKRQVLERFLGSSNSSAPVHSYQTDGTRTALSYDDLKMAFYILYIGLTISALCFLKEVCKF